MTDTLPMPELQPIATPERLLRPLGSVPDPAPVHLWDPTYCGDIDIRIARDGSWFHEGGLIRRQELVQLFSSILRLDSDGRYYLVTPVEKVGIQVEDCPFVALQLQCEGVGTQQILIFTLNTGERVSAGPEHLLVVESSTSDGSPHPVLGVRNGLTALVSRNVFYELVDLAQEEVESGSPVLVLWSQGARMVLGPL